MDITAKISEDEKYYIYEAKFSKPLIDNNGRIKSLHQACLIKTGSKLSDTLEIMTIMTELIENGQ